MLHDCKTQAVAKHALESSEMPVPKIFHAKSVAAFSADGKSFIKRTPNKTLHDVVWLQTLLQNFGVKVWNALMDNYVHVTLLCIVDPAVEGHRDTVQPTQSSTIGSCW